jgi:hypothetical protein
MRLNTIIVGFLALALGSGCATVTAEDQARVFREPARFVGKEVRVCGRLTPTSIVYRANDKAWGLNIWSNEALGRQILYLSNNQGTGCVRGTIEYVGCDSDDEVICTDWTFDYAIKVAEVE